ncbi:nuclease-related domain-containing protein [Candidatus Venteria ishoeyi]|uniref:Nuclease-related domain protein n=1 Tax=Candidatus Venteria ishoeyi TaxID=1899563 RepID=A0A1H6FFF4_9GAMM|nr:nuclease-related domain-containing protein [Candidatus Venteria ishoeyi]SEH08792.1 Nuclease-related domain protein [Candidatus Venteria ishoeyi]
MKEKISPLKSRPLRNPGQSLQDEIDKIFDQSILIHITAPIIFIYLAGMTWFYKYTNHIPSPIFISIIAGIVTIYCFIRVIFLKKKINQLKHARDGEKAVGQYLENFRTKGDVVYHDVIGGQFNIDHVIVSTHGIFVIETKTYSKPKGVEPKIVYSANNIKIDQYNSGKKLIIQAKCESKWLKDMLKTSTGKEFDIQAVIVFPGWFIETRDRQNLSDVWVLNPKALRAFISNSKEVISNEDMKIAAYHISRYIRTYDA